MTLVAESALEVGSSFEDTGLTLEHSVSDGFVFVIAWALDPVFEGGLLLGEEFNHLFRHAIFHSHFLEFFRLLMLEIKRFFASY